MNDLKFVVRVGNDKSAIKQVISAHKFVLPISSPVFYGMFCGKLTETKDSVELPDCEYESLLEFLRFIYSDEVNLSGNNVMQVMYLAKKYMVSSLADKCTQYLHDNLDASNVFSVLPFTENCEEHSLVEQCWKVIDRSTKMAVKLQSFDWLSSHEIQPLYHAREIPAIKSSPGLSGERKSATSSNISMYL